MKKLRTEPKRENPIVTPKAIPSSFPLNQKDVMRSEEQSAHEHQWQQVGSPFESGSPVQTALSPKYKEWRTDIFQLHRGKKNWSQDKTAS